MRCDESRRIFVVRDQSPVAGSSYCLAINRFFMISICSHYTVLYALSVIASFLSHIGGGITVDGVVTTIYSYCILQ